MRSKALVRVQERARLVMELTAVPAEEAGGRDHEAEVAGAMAGLEEKLRFKTAEAQVQPHDLAAHRQGEH